MNFPDDLKYSAEHEWIRIEGDVATIGITDFAQDALGDLVYVEVKTVGETLAKDEIFGAVEAVKTTSDLFMPVSGEVIEFNSELDEKGGDNPSLISEDAYGAGWIIKIKMTNPAELDALMDAVAYKSHVG